MAGSFLASLAFAAAAAPPQAPAPWLVERRRNSCVVRRQAESDSHSLEISSVPGSDLYVLRFAGLAEPRPLPGAFVLHLAPEGQETLRYLRAVPYPANSGIELYLNDRGFLDRLGRSRAATLAGDGGTLAEIGLPGIAAGTWALRACLDEGLRRWGVDPRARAALGRQPVPAGDGTIVQWFRSDDYPISALRAGETGEVFMRVAVSAEGRPESCDVVVSAVPALDQRSCQIILERGRFDPALDASGRPAAARTILKVYWRLED